MARPHGVCTPPFIGYPVKEQRIALLVTHNPMDSLPSTIKAADFVIAAPSGRVEQGTVDSASAPNRTVLHEPSHIARIGER